MVCNTVKEECGHLDRFLAQGESYVEHWLQENRLLPQELTSIIVGYNLRSDFVTNSLFPLFEDQVLKVSTHLSAVQAVSLLASMN